MSYDSTEYYNWRLKAEQNGLLHKATVAYYLDDAKHIYGVYADGRPIPAPIFTYRSWVSSEPIEFPIGSYEDTENVSSYSEDYIEVLRNILRFKSPDTQDIDELLWNGPAYGATSCTRNDFSVDLVPSDYYSVREKPIRLEEELYRALYDGDFEPTAAITNIAPELNRLDTSYRDEVAPDFESILEFRNSPRLVGGNGIVIFNTGDSYKIPLIKRQKSVAESGGWWTPIISGVFQPYTDDETTPNFKNHIYKELAEVFFELDPTEPIPDSFDPLTELDSLLESGTSSLEFTSAGIDCKNTNVQLYSSLIIDDPSYYEEYIQSRTENKFNNSWEVAESKLIDVTDGDELLSLIKPISTVNPYHIMGISEALMKLESEYNATLGIDIKSM